MLTPLLSLIQNSLEINTELTFVVTVCIRLTVSVATVDYFKNIAIPKLIYMTCVIGYWIFFIL